MRCRSRSTRSRDSPRRWVSTNGSAWISHASWVSTARAWGHGSSHASHEHAEPSSPPYGSSSTPASSTASTKRVRQLPGEERADAAGLRGDQLGERRRVGLVEHRDGHLDGPGVVAVGDRGDRGAVADRDGADRSCAGQGATLPQVLLAEGGLLDRAQHGLAPPGAGAAAATGREPRVRRAVHRRGVHRRRETRSRSSASDSSVSAVSPRVRTESAMERLRVSSSATFSSIVPWVTKRWTCTGLVCPMR